MAINKKIYFSNEHRSKQKEIMDDLDFRGLEMQNLLKDLKIVNKWLGGNSITIDGIRDLMEPKLKTDKITILDVGCGDGELLRQCAAFGKQNEYNFELIGVDFNANIIEYAKLKSKEYPNIKFEKVDVFSKENSIPNCDIALCTLFLHHFNNRDIEYLLKRLLDKTSIGLVINDLERNKQAFTLFKIFSKFILKTKTARHDGLISVARGFKKSELVTISKNIPNQKSEISWKWAYRFQWILKNNKQW